MIAGTSHQDLLRRRRLAALVREDARALPPTPAAGDYSALVGFAAETAVAGVGALRRTARQWPLALDDPLAAAYVHGLPLGCLPDDVDGVLPPCSSAARRGAPPPEPQAGARPPNVALERRTHLTPAWRARLPEWAAGCPCANDGGDVDAPPPEEEPDLSMGTGPAVTGIAGGGDY